MIAIKALRPYSKNVQCKQEDLSLVQMHARGEGGGGDITSEPHGTCCLSH